MNYDRATVEHAARTLHRAETGRTLPPNTEMNDVDTAELASYLTRAERALRFVRTYTADAVITADRARQEAA